MSGTDPEGSFMGFNLDYTTGSENIYAGQNLEIRFSSNHTNSQLRMERRSKPQGGSVLQPRVVPQQNYSG